MTIIKADQVKPADPFSDKVKLTKVQAETIEYYVKGCNGDRSKLVFAHTQGSSPIDLDGLNLDTLARALYFGYEVEQTVEEQLLYFYDNLEEDKDWVIKKVLEIIGMKVKGINS